jgi:hypothetical protein
MKLKKEVKKQTAVEWLVKELGIADDSLLFPKVEQAKEMERQQIIDTFQDSRILSVTNNCSSGKQYYNETYEGKEM